MVEKAVCGKENIDLTKGSVKIIGISFSYNKAIQNELNFWATISKIKQFENYVGCEGFPFKERSQYLNHYFYQKLFIFLGVPNNTIEELIKIQKNLWKFTAPKIKHSVTCEGCWCLL